MIEIPRSVLRQFWQALKRSLPPRTPRQQLPWVVVDGRADGLALHAQHADVALRFHLASTRGGDREVVALPSSVLEEAEGRDGNVIVEQQDGKTSVKWMELSAPRALEQPSKDVKTLPAFPSLPKTMVVNPPRVLTALHEAAQCTAVFGTRYATNRILLRGKNDVVGTDGKHLLLQGGFQFPWKNDLLVARSALFSSSVLPTDEEVHVGRGERHVLLHVGAWTVALLIDPQGRFPDFSAVIPSAVRTTLKLSPTDVQQLLRVLPKLAESKEDDRDDVAVTVDLHHRPVIRAREGQHGRASELVLAASTVTGPAMRYVVGRQYLLHALRMGFVEIGCVDPDKVLCCRRGQDKYVFLPLPKEQAIPPGPNVIPIVPSMKEFNTKPVLPIRRGKMPASAPSFRPETAIKADLKPSRNKLASIISGLVGCTRSVFSSFSLRRRKV